MEEVLQTGVLRYTAGDLDAIRDMVGRVRRLELTRSNVIIDEFEDFIKVNIS
jgi:hypothetical protein